MNLTIQQPMPYPFYMNSPRLPFSMPWSPSPYHFPVSPSQQYPSSFQTSPTLSSVSYTLPFVIPPHQHPQHHHHHHHHQAQQQSRPNPSSKSLHTSSSYTNTRYNHLKQSTSNHFNRQRFSDTASPSPHYATTHQHQYRPMKTKSVTDLYQLFHQNSPQLSKAHSWHAINHFQPTHANYTTEIPINRTNLPSVAPPPPPPRPFQQFSPKQKKKSHRKQVSSSSPTQAYNPDLVRISTFDEMPIMTNPLYQENTTDMIKVQKLNETLHENFTKPPSPSSSNSSHSSLQKRLNGSLRNDPLLSAAMDDFRQLRHTPSQPTSTASRRRDLSRDSLCSNSTHHSASSISRSRSQSSFTSLERLQIRRIIESFNSKDSRPLQSLLSKPKSTERTMTKPVLSSVSSKKSKKSSVTEELDRQFNKLRSDNPNQELIYVKPSLLQKNKELVPPLPSLDELIRKAQTQEIETSELKEIEEKTYENPIISIPVPQSSPILSAKLIINEKPPMDNKPEYAIPKKAPNEVNLRSNKKDEHVRSFSFCKPINDIMYETQQTRPVSMLNWFQYGLTNPLPATFQPHKNLRYHDNQHDASIVKENIYASDIDVHIPLSNEKEYLQNSSILKDYIADCKHGSHHSSLFNDFSRLFTRFGNHKHEHKSKMKSKLHKNNHHHVNHNVRCSIM